MRTLTAALAAAVALLGPAVDARTPNAGAEPGRSRANPGVPLWAHPGGGPAAQRGSQSVLARAAPSPIRDVDRLEARPGPAVRCLASWYGARFAGRATASGEPFDPAAFTAAHRTYPLGTVLEVAARGRTVTVRVNDRGPYADTSSRCLDLSRAAFTALAPPGAGVIEIEITKITEERG